MERYIAPPSNQALWDLKHAADHFYHEGRRNRRDTTTAQLIVGLCTIAIGASITYPALIRQFHGGRSR